MKTVFAALNAKYVHTSLAIRSIGMYCRDFSPIIKEYTINDNIDGIIASLHSLRADVIAFSCYIWNIESILYIAQSLKKVNPDLLIILGGHEVTYDAEEIILNNPQIDFIIRGEGEEPVKKLLEALYNSSLNYENVPSLTFMDSGKIRSTPLSVPKSLNELPFPYDEGIAALNGKIIYYESSRGCPYRCSYCLSGRNSGVDFLDVERVKKELLFFIEHNVPLVKFVDRTFNADKKRAREIFEFIIQNSKNTCFHFELAGNLLDEETIAVLKTAPKGIMQFEIGVQTTNTKTLSEIGRKIDFSELKNNVSELLEKDNIHIHLDLIAGLPHESYESFKNSFDEVCSLRPHVLQLGFLKLLKGSSIREASEKFGYKYKSKAPYEVMENDFISFDELIKLKYIEDLFEKYYNSGDFKRSMDFLFRLFKPFEIFEKIYDYYKKNSLFERAISLEKRYEILMDIFLIEDFSDFVRADRVVNPKAKVPYENKGTFKESCFEFLKNEKNIEKYLPAFKGEAPRNIYKTLRFEKLFGGVYMLTKSGELVDITADFNYIKGL